MSSPFKRLTSLLSTLTAPPRPSQEQLGTLSLGEITVPIFETDQPERLPKSDYLLDTNDELTAENLLWLLKKVQLGQDIFLYGPPGPYARRLALTYCSLLHRPYEIVTLHRDVGESELKQGREIRQGGKLEYVDSAAVRAVKRGSILILDGIERCERGVLPILNNLLENREINLEDGTHIVSSARYALMLSNHEDVSSFIPAHPSFLVIAIGTPVPPYPGFPLDPPFRSRFQARYLDSLGTGTVLANERRGDTNKEGKEMVGRLNEAIKAIQIAKEMRTKMASGVTSFEDLPPFPQTSLLKLTSFLSSFPPPNSALSTPSQFLTLLLSIHPSLAYLQTASLRSLESALEGAGLGDYSNGVAECDLSLVENGQGIFGWELERIERVDEMTARLTFLRGGIERIERIVSCGPHPFLPYPLQSDPQESFLLTDRFQHLLTSLFQLHALHSFDISFVPPTSTLQSASTSTTILISKFSKLLGYELSTIHLYKELGGREIWMRRIVKEQGTSWEMAPLVQGAMEGHLVHLEGIDTIGQTVGSLSRLVGEREGELWEGKRIVGGRELTAEEKKSGVLSQTHPSFRIIATPSKSAPPREWLTEELSSTFVSLPTLSMSLSEEKSILLATGCRVEIVDILENFARSYRKANSVPGSKSRRLGTAGLVRIAKRLARFPNEGLWEIVHRTLLSEFLPSTAKGELAMLLEEAGIAKEPTWWNPPPEVTSHSLLFPPASDPNSTSKEYSVPLFDISQDPTGSAHIPYVNNYLNNSQQTALMRDIATDLELLNEHVLLLGNQGTGKNKITDVTLMLLRRPREFIQLHRDSTTQSLMFQTTLDGGVIHYVDSPLLRAVRHGRVIVIDEVDKAAAPVVAGLASLAARGEMTLADGRRIRPASQLGAESDIIVHPNFRMILLANRPSFPFLGNPFVQVLGDAFSCYAVTNPDADSEEKILTQLAPDLDAKLLRSLVKAFGDLRVAFDAGTLSYPFSLRELLALVRHMKAYPDEPLEQVLRNVFDFDINRPETLETLYDILHKHKLGVQRVGIDAVRAGSAATEQKKKQIVIDYKPKGSTELNAPKHGKDTDKAHVGGNTWAGGTGGRDTAGLGGRGGYKRLNKGHDINQVSDALKNDVPDEIKDRARDMARKELAERLKEIDMTSGQASAYSGFYDSVQSHVHQLVTFLDNLEANEEERIWLKRQSDGELDETRITEGLTGESAIYKRRGMEKPELGRPQLKPKRIRFIFDLSASIYRNAYDGRLTRSLEVAVMILEAFSRLSRKEKFRVDIVGQSGEEAVIPLVDLDAMPSNPGDRFKVIQKMNLVPQYAWAGDHTCEAIEKGVASVAEADADDYFVICITDANFERYGITAEDLKRVMNSNPKVKCSLLAIGEGAEAEWLPKALPHKAYRVMNTTDIATTLRAILSQLLDKGL